jgi:predicted nicotinamide N-methyase
MKIIKKVQFWKCSAGANDPDRAASLFGSVYLLEDLDSLEYPIATWPSSLLLAGFVVQNVSLFRGKTILELGAGTSLPSLLCAHQAVGAAKVLVSERPDEPDLHSLIQKGIDLNLCSHICTVTSLDWHRFKPSHFINLPIDIILGADVFYCDEDFTSLFSMLNELFECNPQALFITSYHIRRLVDFHVLP